jgi:hypothetical protein
MKKRGADGVINIDQSMLPPRVRSVACSNGIVDTQSLRDAYTLTQEMAMYKIQMLNQIHHAVKTVLGGSLDPLTTLWRLTCANLTSENNSSAKRARR